MAAERFTATGERTLVYDSREMRFTEWWTNFIRLSAPGIDRYR